MDRGLSRLVLFTPFFCKRFVLCLVLFLFYVVVTAGRHTSTPLPRPHAHVSASPDRDPSRDVSCQYPLPFLITRSASCLDQRYGLYVSVRFFGIPILVCIFR